MGRHRKQKPHLNTSPRRARPHPSYQARQSHIKAPIKKRTSSFFWFYLLILCGVFYWLYSQPKKESQKEQEDTDFLQSVSTPMLLQENIENKKRELNLQKKIQQEEMKAEQFKKPVANIDPLEPEPHSLDRGVDFPEDTSMKAIFEDLKKNPYKNDMYEDPEHYARQQTEHQRWLEEHLKEKSEREQKAFIQKFVQIAKEQGYKVHFTEDMQVLLQPIEEEEKEEKPEEMKITY